MQYRIGGWILWMTMGNTLFGLENSTVSLHLRAGGESVDMKQLHRVILVLEEMTKDYETMPLRMVQVFLSVVARPGITQKELAANLGVGQPTISRLVRRLAGGNDGLDGFGLLRTEPDPHETRRLCVFLTHKGRKVADSIARDLER